jgi:hypothetical protein
MMVQRNERKMSLLIFLNEAVPQSIRQDGGMR